MYENFFGLSASPFPLSPDPRHFFWSKGHSAAHAFLTGPAARGEAVVVLTGDVGAGKTTLVAARLAELDTRQTVVARLMSTQLDVKGLLHAIAIAFGLPLPPAGKTPVSKSQVLKAIEVFLLELLPSGRQALLVIDEAQNLSPEALDGVFLLSTYPPGHRQVLKFILLGQPELRERILENPQRSLDDHMVALHHLGPMQPAEIRAYIEHRLARVGWQGDPEFTIEASARIVSATGGIPRRVNALCNRLLLAAYLSQRHVIDVGDVDAAASELRGELGADPAPAPEPPPAGPARTDNARDTMLSAFTARLDRLEGRVATMLQMVRAFPARPSAGAPSPSASAGPAVRGAPAPPGTPGRRPGA